ncbi:MAG: winged helix-turn-helix domain-containing protein, partial [candidate division Zixibacteria bacterium]|nr:winged helix-turn-helix domain-containing protein [candidate division Zixibacteria bacterium]
GAWIGLKIAALLLIVEGQRPGWIAEVLGLTRMSLTRWIKGVNRSGVKVLKDAERPGRPRRLEGWMQKELEKDLEQSPMSFGLRRVGWDGPTFVRHIENRFGVKLKVRQAQNWLHRLGYQLKRAGYVYVQARASDARKFRAHIKKAPAS